MGANASNINIGHHLPETSSKAHGQFASDASDAMHGTFLSSDAQINSIGLMFSQKDKKLKRFKQKIKTKLKKGNNYGAIFREFANLISISDLAQLYEEYKATFFLKELSHHAESARPIASTIRNDLAELYDYKQNSDITLVYKGVDFPVHKAIVSVRCPYFRELLGKKSTGSVVPVNLDIKGLRVELFNHLLKYLYTGELSSSYNPQSNSSSYKTLLVISQECGVPNALAHDLRYLLDTGMYSDASLCFQSTANEDNSLSSHDLRDALQNKCTCNSEQNDTFSCHQAVISARSRFFRNVILRQQRRNATLKQDNQLNQRIKIILDEKIIPRRFARILLHVMYRDADDLMTLVQSCVCKCSASGTSTNSSNSQLNLVQEMTHLYEIARFLEIDYLVQSCEDLMIDLLNIDTLIPILKWSQQSHGSPWVKRQALTFLKEEFSSVIASSSLLYQLEYAHLLEALKSDFLEASELELLKAIFKWGEYTLNKQQEEPNILSSHSLTRKSLRKKQPDDGRLKELIFELLSFVRIGHVLPIDAEFLTNIAKRGFIDSLPPFMLADDNSLPNNRDFSPWFRNRATSETFIRPRLFSPYFEECKMILEERLGSTNADNFENLTAILNKRCLPAQIPDALYMVDKTNFGGNGSEAISVVSDGDLVSPIANFHFCFTSSSNSSIVCYDEIDKPRPNLPIIEERILLMMRQREQELKTSPFCARALKVAHNRCQCLMLIQLRVVREFGLPDIACQVLHLRNFTSRQAQLAQADMDDNATTVSFSRNDPCDMNLPPPPPCPLPLHSSDSSCDPFSYTSEIKLETSSRYELESQFSSTESHRTLSEMIPDIAITSQELSNLDLTKNC